MDKRSLINKNLRCVYKNNPIVYQKKYKTASKPFVNSLSSVSNLLYFQVNKKYFFILDRTPFTKLSKYNRLIHTRLFNDITYSLEKQNPFENSPILIIRSVKKIKLIKDSVLGDYSLRNLINSKDRGISLSNPYNSYSTKTFIISGDSSNKKTITPNKKERFFSSKINYIKG